MLLISLLVGCVTVEFGTSSELSARGVSLVTTSQTRGAFSYNGTPESETFFLEFASWGRASGKNRAELRAKSNEAEAWLDGNTLWVTSESEPKSGVDISLYGPAYLDLDLLAEDGSVELYDVDGTHVVTANAIYGDGIEGSVDLYARFGSVDVSVAPYDDSVLLIEARDGDVILALPYGLSYDIIVLGDPEYGMDVQDLGFDTLDLSPDFLSATSGRRSIKIDVVVTGGEFVLLEGPWVF